MILRVSELQEQATRFRNSCYTNDRLLKCLGMGTIADLLIEVNYSVYEDFKYNNINFEI